MTNPGERLSGASVRSSLPSLMGDGEEGGGEDPWTNFGLGYALVGGDTDEDVDWKTRYEELEVLMVKFRIDAVKAQDDMKKKMVALKNVVRTSEKKAEEAERKVQVMEKKFSELASLSSVACSCNKPFCAKKNEDYSHSDSVITSLEKEIEEQRRLRILDAKQVEDKAAKIKEWVTNKLKELEDQNQYLREQNTKCNVQLELLKSRLTQLAQFSPNLPRKLTADRGSTEDSSRGSFEDHGESDDSLPSPEVLDLSYQPAEMQRACRDPTLSGVDDCCFHCPSSLHQKVDPNNPSFNSLYASIDYTSKKQQSFAQTASGPPKLKLERKKYAPDGCFTPSTLSTTSDHRFSDINGSLWKRGSSRINSGFGDIDSSNNITNPDLPNSSFSSFNAVNDMSLLNQREAMDNDLKVAADQTLSSEESKLCMDQGNSSKPTIGKRPLTEPNPITSTFDQMEQLNCEHFKQVPDKNALTLDDLTSLNAYKENSSSQDELHDYAEIYTPNKECSDFYTDNDECESVVTDELVNDVLKPPTPPIHRFPSWESRIYDVALNGINVSTEASQMPTHDLSNNNQVKSSTDANHSNAAFTDLSIPVYASVKGRASQIRSVPFTGDSSDSSDNEDARITMTTTSSQTTSGDTESSASAGPSGQDISPVDKKLFLNNLSKCQGTSNSPLKIARREMSNESVLSNDYAVPPDAVSADGVSLNSSDIRPNFMNTPTFYRRIFNSEDTQKKEILEKSGYLTKLGGKFKTWRKRWFVLNNGTLNYYKSQTDVNRKPQGQIVLDNVCRVNRAEGAATFEISTGKRVYYLTADSISMMEEWIKVIQNVLCRNATKMLLTQDDKLAAEGWLTKVKHGHSRRCWCVLIGRVFLYFKTPNDCNPLGQINMRDARVEEVLHVSDSDEDDNDHNKVTKSEYTVGIFPNHQGPTYLLMDNKQELDSWLYHLTVVSSGDNLAGTQYEQLIAKLMEINGDESCVAWKHPLLLYSKDPITQPLTTLPSEQLQQEAVKLFKSLQLFMSVPLDTSGIEYHVVLAQNSLYQCLIYPELQNELFCQLIKQTSRHCHHKTGVQQLLICATQSLFMCDTSSTEKTSSSSSTEKSIPSESKLNPAPFVFVQAWQLLALSVSLFLPKNRTLWYLRMHLQRNANTKLEAGKYAIFCQRALERALSNGGRECKPSRMEVLSILLKNPYHHCLPHSIPVHFVNGTYQVFGFDGSTTIQEFTKTVNREVGIRDCEYSGFALFSDDPIEKDLEHCLLKDAKVCDVISQWEQALRVQHFGKFENTKVLKLTYKNRLILRQNGKAETDKERLLLVYQINEEIMEGKFPLSKELAMELAALLTQIEFGDYSIDTNSKASDANSKVTIQISQVMDQFFPQKFRDAISDKNMSELLREKWIALKGRSAVDCVRIYLNCARKWSFSGGKLFPAKFKSGSLQNVWLAVAENCIAILDTSSLRCLWRYPYDSVMTFGGCRDDFMLVIGTQNSPTERERCSTERLLFSMTKPKILEITLLIADYMNAISQHETNSKRCTSSLSPSSRDSFSAKFRSKIRANNAVSQNSNTTAGSIALDSSPDHAK